MKTNIITFAVTLLLILSTSAQNAFAEDLPSYYKECEKVAISKLTSKARLQNANITYIELYASDLTWYKPSKYFLFLAKAVTVEGSEIELTVVVQKPFLPPGACL